MSNNVNSGRFSEVGYSLSEVGYGLSEVGRDIHFIIYEILLRDFYKEYSKAGCGKKISLPYCGLGLTCKLINSYISEFKAAVIETIKRGKGLFTKLAAEYLIITGGDKIILHEPAYHISNETNPFMLNRKYKKYAAMILLTSADKTFTLPFYNHIVNKKYIIVKYRTKYVNCSKSDFVYTIKFYDKSNYKINYSDKIGDGLKMILYFKNNQGLQMHITYETRRADTIIYFKINGTYSFNYNYAKLEKYELKNHNIQKEISTSEGLINLFYNFMKQNLSEDEMSAAEIQINNFINEKISFDGNEYVTFNRFMELLRPTLERPKSTLERPKSTS